MLHVLLFAVLLPLQEFVSSLKDQQTKGSTMCNILTTSVPLLHPTFYQGRYFISNQHPFLTFVTLLP
jgi:hypothetical protein